MTDVYILPEVPAFNLCGDDHLDSSSLSQMICAMPAELKGKEMKYTECKIPRKLKITYIESIRENEYILILKSHKGPFFFGTAIALNRNFN